MPCGKLYSNWLMDKKSPAPAGLFRRKYYTFSIYVERYYFIPRTSIAPLKFGASSAWLPEITAGLGCGTVVCPGADKRKAPVEI